MYDYMYNSDTARFGTIHVECPILYITTRSEDKNVSRAMSQTFCIRAYSPPPSVEEHL